MMFRTVLVLAGVAAAGFAQTASPEPVTLAVYLLVACSTEGAGQPVKLPGVEPSLCLDRTPFLTGRDVRSAEFHKNSKGRPTVFLTFREDAAIRELDITRKNIGKRVGIVLNGRVVAAPSIAASSRFLYIDANYTEKQVERLVAAFNRQAGKR
jgi:preprotein translocase subunit SecD